MIEHIEQGALAPNIRACIALTSWKKRINTVGLTIYNLFETCGPDYHIVLTLAEEEFPKKEQELPRDLVLMNKAGVFEILWVKKNYRAFKKWIFCSKRFPLVPIISADDDCIYTYNYANELYNAWRMHPKSVISYHLYNLGGKMFQNGPATLYPPNTIDVNKCALNKFVALNADDVFIGIILHELNIDIIELRHDRPYVFHDCTSALSEHEMSVRTYYDIMHPMIKCYCEIIKQ